ncbi:lysophosphatidic acid receptor 6 isoform X2 [Pogona vitticeps]|uniref:Lysophosphatidic acid receptor 6-like isoform X2 n=1 Tax=Pogona vitticeps TaxID=103695 RepID=A0A6J0URU6_9SAUR|nr:lysophosphatidic acid receptor 6-like isoform X2 [Pogona vitticeps]
MEVAEEPSWNFSMLPPGVTLWNSSSITSNCSETADFQYLLFPVVYSLVFVLGLAGNLFVLSYFLRTKSATSPANVFLVNLATIDFLFVLTLPFRIAYHALHNDWLFGEVLCKITGCLFFANLYGSSLFLACICLERYVAVVHPLWHLQFREFRYRWSIALGVWAVLVAAILYLALRGPLTSSFADGRTACLENFSSSSWKGRISGVSIFAAVVGFLLPLVLIGICYPLIAWRLLASPGIQPGSRAVRRKALRTVLVVLGVFLICFAPYHLVQLVHTLGRVGVLGGCPLIRATYVARRVTMALTSLNACLDPLVYYFAAERFALQPDWWHCSCCHLERFQRSVGLHVLAASKGSSSGETAGLETVHSAGSPIPTG